jgi:CRISPR-associated endonuclease/helicase Cas3
MNATQILAHPDQSLVKHLLGVARRAKDFAARFQGENQAELAALLHDLGKAEKEFQDRIAGNKAEKRPHAPHGAALALERQVWPVAFAIYGHHAGLHDRSDLQQVPSRWTTAAHGCEGLLKGDGDWEGQTWPITMFGKTLPAWLEGISFTTAGECDAKMRAVDFYTRMIFSVLVDADRLDTEDANRAEGSQANVLKRKAWRFGPKCLATNGAAESLLKMLESAISERVAAARSKNASDAVMDVRAKVLATCKEKATGDRGVFTLAVPTGGGKTLASIAFALHHIVHHNKTLAKDDPRRLRRIIVVIPYLNIIQQTTRELRDVFKCIVADPLILEHHSQASDPEIKGGEKNKNGNDADGYDNERPLRQLAAENWDAPIVVTTSVQFFDSLFSRRPADARKLHNICQSVLIFDEVQTLPPLLLQPILDALKELTNTQRRYGCSLVLCTATQPALSKSDDFEFGFENPTPIIAPEIASEHFKRLKRVEYRGLAKDSPPPDMDNLALVTAMLAAPYKQALTILNTRKQARALFDLLAEKTKDDQSLRDAVFHLSTWMYPAHRLQVLAEVAKRLNDKKPCFLVSTQCVEAGVDVDFPAVWRAFGPYDSIVQAAGRCNRSGALKGNAGQPILGQVQVFTPSDPAKPGGIYESAMQTSTLLCRMDKADPHDPDSFKRYFQLFYQTTVPDPGGCAVQSARERLHFKEVSEIFNFIDADSVPLLIESKRDIGAETDSEMLLPNGSTVRLLRESARHKGYFTPDEWRALQPFIVNLSFPMGKETRAFLHASDSELVFKSDDEVRGLRFLKIGILYSDGYHGSGIDVSAECLARLDYCP